VPSGEKMNTDLPIKNLKLSFQEFCFLRKRVFLVLSTEQILQWTAFVGLVSPFTFVQVRLGMT
jgi:hypothetical protein